MSLSKKGNLFFNPRNVWGGFIVLGLILVLTGCGKCSNVDCVNGDCNEGTCICDEGFSGERCQNNDAAQVAGSYEIFDNCSLTERDTFQLSIEKIETLGFIRIVNLGDYASNVEGTLQGQNFKIDSQFVNGRMFWGVGSFDTLNDALTIRYHVAINSTIDSCEATGTLLN